MVSDDNDDNDFPYTPYNEIDFSRMHMVFQRLSLFDNLFFSMQAMNIAVVDPAITEWEYELLHKLIETERTPTQEAIFVSAQSQMWIFALYELLRTWRQRIDEIRRHLMAGTLEQHVATLTRNEVNVAALMQRKAAKSVMEDCARADKMFADYDLMEPVFRLAETVRINLAKHEAPKDRRNRFMPRAPGYGRIDCWCGALNYEIVHTDGGLSHVNRRQIADAIRAVRVSAD
jgi:hypothetical protein